MKLINIANKIVIDLTDVRHIKKDQREEVVKDFLDRKEGKVLLIPCIEIAYKGLEEKTYIDFDMIEQRDTEIEKIWGEWLE